MIGNEPGLNRYFQGAIDEAMVSNRDLTANQILDLQGTNRAIEFPFEEGTGATTADISGNGQTGTLTNGPTWVTGKVGSYALHFNGTNNYVACGNLSTINTSGQVSIAAWVKPDDTTGIHTIASHGNALYLRINNGRYEIQSYDGHSVYGISAAVPAGDTGQWVHLVGVYDGQFWKLYRNGVLLAATQRAAGAVPINGQWLIGMTGYGVGNNFAGDIDDVRVYVRALSDDEIASISQLSLLAGRLVKITDRNGYATTITYRDSDFTAQQLSDSPDRRWQMRTITDPNGRTATFHYVSEQQSGQWVIQSIDLPNGQTVSYGYADGKLATATYADGTQSTFKYNFDPTSQCTTVEYNDVAASGSHRHKTAYLTNNVAITAADATTADLYNQSSLMIHMLLNGEQEVKYLNIGNPDGSNAETIYEGSGHLKQIGGATDVQYYKQGWTIDPSQGYAGISGTRESVYASAQGLGFSAAAHGTLYYHANRQYCATALSDSSGTVTERYTYTSYGVTTILDADGTTTRATSSISNAILYTGRRLDPETASTSTGANYYYRTRCYDPSLGTWISRDISYLDRFNLYQYTGSNPTINVDPNGTSYSHRAPIILDPWPWKNNEQCTDPCPSWLAVGIERSCLQKAINIVIQKEPIIDMNFEACVAGCKNFQNARDKQACERGCREDRDMEFHDAAVTAAETDIPDCMLNNMPRLCSNVVFHTLVFEARVELVDEWFPRPEPNHR